MTASWRDTREQFRHGDLPAALIRVALARFEADGAEAISLRDLARAVGVNHRAVYRHFPDKLSLMARVAQEGWLLLGGQIEHGIKGRKSGEEDTCRRWRRAVHLRACASQPVSADGWRSIQRQPWLCRSRHGHRTNLGPSAPRIQRCRRPRKGDADTHPDLRVGIARHRQSNSRKALPTVARKCRA